MLRCYWGSWWGGAVSEAGRLGLLHPPHLLGSMGPELILSKFSAAQPVWLSV